MNNQSSVNSCQNDNLINKINTIIPLIWVVVGTITNILSLIIFMRQNMRKNSTFAYLTLMSACDCIMLWTSSLRDYLAYKHNIYISGTLMCKFHTFLFFFIAQLSSWLLVGANLDRLIFIVFNNNRYAKVLCQRQMAIKYLCILVCLLFIVNFHFLIFIQSTTSLMALNQTTDYLSVHPYVYPKCIILEYNKLYKKFYTNFYLWLDSCLYSLIPFLIVTICNSVLIIKVFSTKRNLYTRYSINQNPKNRESSSSIKQKKAITAIANGNGYQIKDDSHSNGHMIKVVHKYSIISNRLSTSLRKSSSTSSKYIRNYKYIDTNERVRNMAITIICVTLLFIIFTVPINIYIPITTYLSNHHEQQHSHDDSNTTTTTTTSTNSVQECQDLLFTILNNMVNAQHSVNFFIYITTNTKFRMEFKQLIHYLFKTKQSKKTKSHRTTTNAAVAFTTTSNCNGNGVGSACLAINQKPLLKQSVSFNLILATPARTPSLTPRPSMT